MRSAIRREGIGALLVLSMVLGCQKPGLKAGEGYVQVEGGRIWYRIVGSGTRTPLLVLHGGPGMPSFYLKPLAALADERPVVFYDQLGAGHSERPNDTKLWRTERFIDELARVRQALGLREIHLYGHSWGSMLATDYLLTHPTGIKSVIFAGPALSIPRWLKDADSLRSTLPNDVQAVIASHEAARTTDTPEYQAAVNEFYKLYFARRQPWSADVESTFAQMGMSVYTTMWGPSEFTATGPLKTYERSDRLHELTMPVLFTAGRYDEARPATVQYLQSLIPGSKLEILENSGHLSMQDEPERSVQILRDFLHEVESSK